MVHRIDRSATRTSDVHRLSVIRYACVLTVLLTSFYCGAPALGQLTVKSVLQESAEQIDSRHADVVKAINKFRQRDFDGARALLEAARAEDPKLPPANVLLATMERQIGRFDSAIALLNTVVDEYPEEPEPYLVYGEQALVHQRMTEADLLFAKTLALAQAYKGNDFRKRKLLARAYAGLAAVGKERNNWPLTEKYLVAWTKSAPTDPAAFQRLGEARLKLAQTDEAYTAFQRAAELDKAAPSANVAVALLLEEAGRQEESTKYINKALAAEAESLSTAIAIARWLINAQRFEEANRQLEKSAATFPDSADLAVLRGITAAMLEQQETARQHFYQALEHDPKNFEARNQLVLLLVDSSHREDRRTAVSHAEINILLQPNHAEAGISLGWAYDQIGRIAQSQQALSAAFKAGSLPPDSSYLVARIFYDRGRAADAAQLLEGSLQSKTWFIRRTKAQQLLDRVRGKDGPQ